MRKFLIIGILLLAIATPLVIALLYRGKTVNPKAVTLNYWIVDGNEKDYTEMVDAYHSYHPYVNIKFKKIKLEEYENALIQGWARDQGPDIFSLPNTWLKKYKEFIQPLPSQTNVAYYQTQKFLFKTSVKISYIPKTSLTPADIRNSYIDLISQDVILKDSANKEKIYGLPYSVDTLALFYNKDLLSNAKIVEPARTWKDIVDQTPKLTKLDSQNNILQSSVALGLSANIDNYFDILSLLMLQNGVQMYSSSDNKITFTTGDNNTLASQALDFYASFADLNKETYSWNEKQTRAIDAFIAGRSAYYLGYLADKKTIDEQAAGLNYDVADMLHVNSDGTDRLLNRAGNPTQVNAGRYWAATVSKKSKASNEAWDFVQFIAREKRDKEFVDKTGEISPLKAVLVNQVKNQTLAVWANQALTAKSWYQGRDASAVEKIFGEMINSVALQSESPSEALKTAAGKISITL